MLFQFAFLSLRVHLCIYTVMIYTLSFLDVLQSHQILSLCEWHKDQVVRIQLTTFWSIFGDSNDLLVRIFFDSLRKYTTMSSHLQKYFFISNSHLNVVKAP